MELIKITVPVRGRLGRIAAVCAAMSAFIGVVVSILGLFSLRDSLVYVDLQALYRTSAEVPSEGLITVASDRLVGKQTDPLFVACGNGGALSVRGLRTVSVPGLEVDCRGFIAEGPLVPASSYSTEGFRGVRLIGNSMSAIDATRALSWTRFMGWGVYWLVGFLLFVAWSGCHERVSVEKEFDVAMRPMVWVVGIASVVAFLLLLPKAREGLSGWEYLGGFATLVGISLLIGFVFVFPLTQAAVFVASPIMLGMSLQGRSSSFTMYLWAIPVAIAGALTIYFLALYALFAIMRAVIWVLVPTWLFNLYEIALSGV